MDRLRYRLFAALMALLLLAGACSGDDDAGDDAGGGVATIDDDTGDAAADEDAGDAADSDAGGSDDGGEAEPDGDAPAAEPDPELIAAIDDEIAAWMTEGDIDVPGLTLTVSLPDGGEIRTAAGVTDLRTEEEVTPDDYFRIGSITKTITTVAVLQLVDEGLIELDEPVSTYLGDDWLTDFTFEGTDYAGAVTVRDILSHTDGFAEFAWDPGFYLETSARLDEAYEPEELIDWGQRQGAQYEPGTDYQYNTVGHVAAGLVIEAVTGNDAEAELQSRIFDPLELDHIFLPPAATPPEPVVKGYAVGDLKAALDLIPVTDEYRDQGEFEIDGSVYYDMSVIPQAAIASAGWTGGGIEAQVADVAVIFRAVFDGTLLSDEMVAEFTTTNDFSNYALGLNVGEDTAPDAEPTTAYSHGGGVPGFRSHAVYWPEHDISLAMSANAVPIDPDVGALAERLLGVLTTE